MNYEELEKELEHTKMYAKRTMDLWADAKKWRWLAEHSEDEASKIKYMEVSNTLMALFNKEVETMKL